MNIMSFRLHQHLMMKDLTLLLIRMAQLNHLSFSWVGPDVMTGDDLTIEKLEKGNTVTVQIPGHSKLGRQNMQFNFIYTVGI